jgi:putative pyruvate formate lyase activating enzyme
MSDLGSLSVWQDSAIRGALSWYLDVAQFHPDNFCDPASVKYRDKYAEIARRPTLTELDASWRRARELGLNFETATFERRNTFSTSAILDI